MAAQGQPVKRVSVDAQQQGDTSAAAPQLTAEDLAGWSKVGTNLTRCDHDSGLICCMWALFQCMQVLSRVHVQWQVVYMQLAAGAFIDGDLLSAALQVQQLLSTVAAAAGGTNVEGEGGTEHGSCSSSGRTSTRGEAAVSAGGCGGAASAETAAAAAAAAAVADSGVVQVAPEDVEAWTRVQQQQQG